VGSPLFPFGILLEPTLRTAYENSQIFCAVMSASIIPLVYHDGLVTNQQIERSCRTWQGFLQVCLGARQAEGRT
jgi:hypothetical protein